MIKRIVLGDMHGHIDHVKDIYDYEKPDEVIMLGDYLDSGSVLLKDQYKAFDELIKMKENHKDPNKFILLIGNHDFHYMYDRASYSGYSNNTWVTMHHTLMKLFERKKMQFIYVDKINNIIYSHAGISNIWFNEHCNNISELEDINQLNFRSFDFTYGNSFNVFGDDPLNGPLWVRPMSLSKNMLANKNGEKYVQIVGHTQTKQPVMFDYNGNLHLDYDNLKDIKLITIDNLPFYYIKETLNDDMNIIERKIVERKKYESSYIQ